MYHKSAIIPITENIRMTRERTVYHPRVRVYFPSIVIEITGEEKGTLSLSQGELVTLL